MVLRQVWDPLQVPLACRNQQISIGVSLSVELIASNKTGISLLFSLTSTISPSFKEYEE